jgi:hypothetical protein
MKEQEYVGICNDCADAREYVISDNDKPPNITLYDNEVLPPKEDPEE